MKSFCSILLVHFSFNQCLCFFPTWIKKQEFNKLKKRNKIFQRQYQRILESILIPFVSLKNSLLHSSVILYNIFLLVPKSYRICLFYICIKLDIEIPIFWKKHKMPFYKFFSSFCESYIILCIIS